MNFDDLIQIFYSGGNERRADLQDISDLLYFINSDLLNHTAYPIVNKDVFYSYSDKLRSGEVKALDVDGGSYGHMALKCIGIDMLSETISPRSLIEIDFAGYRPDIITTDHSIIIECGTVNPQKISAYFKIPTVQKIHILPYPNEESVSIFCHTFMASSEFSEFIKFAEKEKLNVVKKLHKKINSNLS
jgi:hypothetical protein